MGPGLYGSGPVVGLKDLNLVCGDKDTGEVTQFRSDRMISFNKGSMVELAVQLQNKDYYTKRQKKILGMRQSSEAY